MIGCWTDDTQATTDCDRSQRLYCCANQSLSRNGWKQTSIGLIVVTLSVAFFWGVQGYWLIPGFAVLHLMIVLMGLRAAMLNNRDELLITINHEIVAIRQQTHGTICSWKKPVAWLQMRLERCDKRRIGSPATRLWLIHQSDRFELGGFLSESERRQLAEQLYDGLRVNSLLLSRLPDRADYMHPLRVCRKP